MPHKDFNLSFNNFRILNVAFSVNEEFSGKKTIPINTRLSVAHKYNKNNLEVRLKVSSNQDDIPFFFDVESEGRFSFEQEPDEKTIKTVALINAPAILFPYIRETIADLTRRAGFKPLHLPPVNFVKYAVGVTPPKKRAPNSIAKGKKI